MKTQFIIAFAAALLFASCKKEEENPVPKLTATSTLQFEGKVDGSPLSITTPDERFNRYSDWNSTSYDSGQTLYTSFLGGYSLIRFPTSGL